MNIKNKYENDLFLWFNWRLILFNFISFFFYVYTAQIFSYLRDLRKYKLVTGLNDGQKPEVYDAVKASIAPRDNLSDYLTDSIYFGLCGLGIAFLIAILISRKNKWHWLNSLLAFIVMFLLWSNALGWTIVRDYFALFRALFNSTFFGLFFNGLILLFIGSFFFFSKWSRRFIEAGNGASKTHIDRSTNR